MPAAGVKLIDAPGVVELWAVLPEARIVGGAVRDFLAGQPIKDIDFAVPLLPGQMTERLLAVGIKAVPTGVAHGTVTAVVAGRGFEVTTLRRDVETDGRRAVVAFTDDWREDADRRDFTINAMSMERDGAVHDYFGGRADLAAGRVRFVGAAEAKIEEDYLRILRFFRFFARYGRGGADAAAVAAIAGLKAGLARLSAERVWGELKQILSVGDPRGAVGLMAATGVLGIVVPEANVGALERLVAVAAPPEPLLRLAALLAGDVTAFAAAKKLGTAEQERLFALRRPATLQPDADDAALRRALADEPASLLVARSWLGQDARPGWNDLRHRIEATDVPVLPLRGRDLLALGVSPGAALGRLLERVRAWWWDDGCVADAAACLNYAKQLLQA